ncbi:hypothetical protein SDC9_204448 [bioreactor metagenome]|uniref:Uncharacterized protein n=1 Tax=bioreactor metagenome TaxID=1076179 RepID=A0A645IZY5_9ZZZZ
MDMESPMISTFFLFCVQLAQAINSISKQSVLKKTFFLFFIFYNLFICEISLSKTY